MIYINSFIDIIHEFQNIMCKRWTAYQALDCMNINSGKYTLSSATFIKKFMSGPHWRRPTLGRQADLEYDGNGKRKGQGEGEGDEGRGREEEAIMLSETSMKEGQLQHFYVYTNYSDECLKCRPFIFKRSHLKSKISKQ